MLKLSSALERIDNWLQENYAHGYSFLQPGLSEADIPEIDAIVQYLPFHLSQEVYKLYSWKNGTREGTYAPVSGQHFPSLSKAVREYCDILERARSNAALYGREPSKTWWKTHWFPIFEIDHGQYFTIMSNVQEAESPIFLCDFNNYDLDEGPLFAYTNLTSMMETLAECLEMGAIYGSEDEYGYIIGFQMDGQAAEKIRIKHNPGIKGHYLDVFPDETLYTPGY